MTRTRRSLILASCLILALAGREAAAAGRQLLVYIGTYTRGASKGIYAYRLDLASGSLAPMGLAAETANPSFLAVHPNRRFLYAVGEMNEFGGQKGGAVSAFSVDRATGKLTLLNQQSSGGAGPCHLVVDRSGRFVLVANYGGGSISALPVSGDGRLGEATAFIQHSGSGANPERQQGPHAHSINLDAANRHAVAADLGLDKLLVYKFDPARGTLAPNHEPFAALKPGAGPRHFAFHPSGRFGYVINEMHCTVTALGYQGKAGRFRELQTISTCPVRSRRVTRPPKCRCIHRASFSTGPIADTIASPSSPSTRRKARSRRSSTSRRRAGFPATSESIQREPSCWPPIRTPTAWWCSESIPGPARWRRPATGRKCRSLCA